MRLDAEGVTVYSGQEVVSRRQLETLAGALGTESAADTATLVPFFGPTVAGESRVVDALGLDLSRALLGGLRYEWTRPFRDGETVAVRVFVDQVYDRGANRFGVVVAEFTGSDGAPIQRQSSTFIERRSD